MAREFILHPNGLRAPRPRWTVTAANPTQGVNATASAVAAAVAAVAALPVPDATEFLAAAPIGADLAQGQQHPLVGPLPPVNVTSSMSSSTAASSGPQAELDEDLVPLLAKLESAYTAAAAAFDAVGGYGRDGDGGGGALAALDGAGFGHGLSTAWELVKVRQQVLLLTTGRAFKFVCMDYKHDKEMSDKVIVYLFARFSWIRNDTGVTVVWFLLPSVNQLKSYHLIIDNIAGLTGLNKQNYFSILNESYLMRKRRP